MTRIGSLFSGYGGLDMAVESVVGGTLAWYSEIEPAACKVLAAHHPGVPNLGDITTIDWSHVEPVDVLTGGYPCQPFSHAGQRKGKADERHLYPYVSAAIDALRPGLVVLENVRGHLTLGFGDVLADLSRVGYDARWGVVRASDAGAPHGRARIFIVAYPSRGTGREGPGWGVSESSRAAGLAARDLGAAADAEGDEQREPAKPRAVRAESRDGDHRPAADADVRRREQCDTGFGCVPVADAVGGDQPAADADSAGRQGRDSSEEGGSECACSGSEPCARPESSCGQRADRDAIAADAHSSGWHSSLFVREGEGELRRHDAPRSINWGKYAAAIHRWESILGRPAPSPTTPGSNGRPRLSPVFVEWMMSLPEGHVTGHGLRPAQELKLLGNGVVPVQAAMALRMLGVS